MSVTKVFGGLILLLLLSIGWNLSKSNAVQAWLHPPDRRPATITFDNGTVRQTEPASGPVVLGEPILAPGGMRKCKKGKTTVYTDRSCPPGTQEAAITNGTVNVVAGQAVPKPAGASPEGHARAPCGSAGRAGHAGPGSTERQAPRAGSQSVTGIPSSRCGGGRA